MKYHRIIVGALGANCYLLYQDGAAAVIDPGDHAPVILAEIEKLSLRVSAILLTHAHFDHMMAADIVRRETGAPIIAFEDDFDAVSDCSLSMMPPYLPRFSADRRVSNGEIINAGELRIQVIHTPGHTPGSMCLACGDLLFTGDTLFAGTIGRTDFPGGDPHAMRRSLAVLYGLDNNYTVLPGHGDAAMLDTERAVNPYMREFQR